VQASHPSKSSHSTTQSEAELATVSGCKYMPYHYATKSQQQLPNNQ